MWPFRKLSATEREEREWLRYQDHLASTLWANGYRGSRVEAWEARQWAAAYVANARAEREHWRKADAEDVQ